MNTICSNNQNEKTSSYNVKKFSSELNFNLHDNEENEKHENEKLIDESYNNQKRKYYDNEVKKNNEATCTTSTLLVFNTPRSLIISCVLLKYDNHHFLNCIKNNEFDGGASCVKKAFLNCFATSNTKNEIENVMGVQSNEHNSILTSKFHINSQLAKEKFQNAANNVKDFFLGIHHENKNENLYNHENGNFITNDDDKNENEITKTTNKSDDTENSYLKKYYEYGEESNSVFSIANWKINRNARLFWTGRKAFEGRHLLYKENSLFATALNRNIKLNKNIYECNNCSTIEDYNNNNNNNNDDNNKNFNKNYKNNNNNGNDNEINENANKEKSSQINQNKKIKNENIFENFHRNLSSRNKDAFTAAIKELDALPSLNRREMIEEKLREVSVSEPDERTFSREKERSINILIVGSDSSGIQLIYKTLSQHPNIIPSHNSYNAPIYKYYNYKNNYTKIDYNQNEKKNYYRNKKNDKIFLNSNFKIHTGYKKFQSCNQKIEIFEKSNHYKLETFESNRYNNWNCFPFIEQNENFITIDKIDYPLSEENLSEIKTTVNFFFFFVYI